MSVTYANTQKIKEIGSEIVGLANEYNVKITELFKKLSTFPYDTKAWNGIPAEKYAEHVSLEKVIYTNFADELKEFGSQIIETANNIEECCETTLSGGDYKI